ncbi:hypothetical protein QBA54_07305 [Streptomyces sp. B21-108]|jgi:hypothetical protein|uniref:hypothetical protein n=1 Tax=Streptomyces sp. B21-108 TaxID=3039419 RepID=UPI002FF2C8D2
MATVKQYTLSLWRAHRAVCRKLGADLSWGDSTERIRMIGSDVMLAGLIKVLTDKGLVTDQELNTVFAAITNSDFPALSPVLAPEPGHETADPDLGS